MIFFHRLSKVKELLYFSPMDGQPKLNLQKNRLPKIPNRYWLRIAIYATFLGALLWWTSSKNDKMKVAEPSQIEFDGLYIETDEIDYE
jgi:hypothetical protein